MSAERGLAAAVLLFVVALLGALWLALGPAREPAISVADSARFRLVAARRALRDVAVNTPSMYRDSDSVGPGHLPCPDRDGDGSPQGSCGPLPLGLMPVALLERGLTLQAAAAVSARPLWYALSSPHRYNPPPSGAPHSALRVDSDTVGELSLDGRGDLVAVLIDPGPPLPGQRRLPGTVPDPRDYLEGENADGDADFVDGEGNDRALALSRRDLMALVEQRVLAEFAARLGDYRRRHGHWPWLAPIDSALIDGDSVCRPCNYRGWLAADRYRPGWRSGEARCADAEQPGLELPAWAVRNFWHRRIWLQLAPDTRCPAAPAAPRWAGRPVAALLAAVGAPLAAPAHGGGAQRRSPGVGLENYLDSAMAIDGDGDFGPLQGEGINDRWLVLP